MNEERKEKVVKATELIGRACDLMTQVRDQETANYEALSDEQKQSAYGQSIKGGIDDIVDVIDDLDNAQTAMVELTELAKANEEENKYNRVEDDEDEDSLISALGWNEDNLDKNLARVKRFCARLGIELEYSLAKK